MPDTGGSTEVREFYDTRGWKESGSGALLDQELFGNREWGEVRREAHARRIQRLCDMFADLPCPLHLLECGCGGNPALFLLHLCRSYTGVDFSQTGLQVTRTKLAAAGVPSRLVAADLCHLPFADGSFDAAYSAHALYHIPDPAAQGRAFDEIMRVVKPGGVAVFVLANPRPLVFPGRLLRRLVADTPILGGLIDRLRRQPPLPYNPQSLGWMRRRLAKVADVQIDGYAMASTWFNQQVSERGGLGRLLWKAVTWMERTHPRLAARLGNYVLIRAAKHIAPAGAFSASHP